DDIAAGRDEVIGRHAHRHECEGEEVVDRGQRKQSPEHFSTSGVDSTAKMSRKSFYFPYFWSLQRQRHFADRAGLVGVEPFLSRQACREDLRRDDIRDRGQLFLHTSREAVNSVAAPPAF